MMDQMRDKVIQNILRVKKIDKQLFKEPADLAVKYIKNIQKRLDPAPRPQI